MASHHGLAMYLDIGSNLGEANYRGVAMRVLQAITKLVTDSAVNSLFVCFCKCAFVHLV